MILLGSRVVNYVPCGKRLQGKLLQGKLLREKLTRRSKSDTDPQ
jgi:hypothetical protein